MSEQPHVGLSLVKQAPYGLAVSVIIALVAALSFSSLTVVTLAYAVVGGLVCASLLLAYWLGKGGIYFIAGVSVPLLLVVVSPLASMAALLYLISGFFSGFWLVLLGYKFSNKKA